MRRQHAAVLVHPEDLTGEAAMAIVRPALKADFEKHRRWLVIDGVLVLLSALLILVPGPNVLGYYFAFRVVGHYFSMRGARQALDHVVWTTRAQRRPRRPAAPGAGRLRRAAPSRRGHRGATGADATCAASSIAWPSPARDISHGCDACRPCRPPGLPPRWRRRDRDRARRHPRSGRARRPDVSRQSQVRPGRAADQGERDHPGRRCAGRPVRDAALGASLSVVCRRAGAARPQRTASRRRAPDGGGRR